MRLICSEKAPSKFLLPGGKKCIDLITVLICILFSCNALADGDIVPPGHKPSRSDFLEDTQRLPEGSQLFSPFSDTIENMTDLNLILTPLIRYWMPFYGPGGDHMTSIKGANENPFLFKVNQGILYYVSSSAGKNTLPLYRLLSTSSDRDHMDANTVDMPGYKADCFLGYTYALANDGMFPIKRLVQPSPVDHLTAFYGEMITGYVDDAQLGYGYPRFGEIDGPGNQHKPLLSKISYNGVVVNADLSWGGVIYELWWNGKQFVNHNDCGREIQTALFKPGLSDIQFGPTEAGDRMFFGSPLSEIWATEKGIYTRSSPLQWDPRSYGGGANNPVLYGGEFDRRAIFMMHRFHKIICYTVGYKPAESTNYIREWVTAYLNLDVSSRFFLNTLQGGTEEIPMPSDSQNVTRSIDEGAIITASTDLNYAIGFFTPSPAYFSWWNFDRQESASEKTRKISLWDNGNYMESGTWYRRTVYLLVGSLNDVQGGIAFLRDRLSAPSAGLTSQ